MPNPAKVEEATEDQHDQRESERREARGSEWMVISPRSADALHSIIPMVEVRTPAGHYEDHATLEE